MMAGNWSKDDTKDLLVQIENKWNIYDLKIDKEQERISEIFLNVNEEDYDAVEANQDDDDCPTLVAVYDKSQEDSDGVDLSESDSITDFAELKAVHSRLQQDYIKLNYEVQKYRNIFRWNWAQPFSPMRLQTSKEIAYLQRKYQKLLQDFNAMQAEVRCD